MFDDYKPLFVYCDISTMSCDSDTIDTLLDKHAKEVVKISDSFWFITIDKDIGIEDYAAPQTFLSDIVFSEYCDERTIMLICDVSDPRFFDYWIPDDINEKIKSLIE